MNRVGTCIYCGQERMVEVEEAATHEEISIKASKECTCKEGKEARENEVKIQKAKNDIESLFVDCKEAADLFYAGLNLLVKEQIKNLQVDLGDGVKGKLSTTNDGKIKVERTETSKIIRTSNA